MEKGIYIFYIKQTEKLSEDIFQKLLLQLPEQFQKDINAYKHWESAQASLLGKILLLYGFKNLNISYSLYDIQIGEKDRPFLSFTAESLLKDTVSGFIDFNISHSGEYIICAITQNAKVGIDIEKHRKLNVDLFKKYFDDNEWNEIQTSEDVQKTFFDLWSIKESVIKCDGRGVEILSETHKQYQQNNSNTVLCDAIIFHYQQVEIAPDYACCVCSNEEFKIKLTMLHLSDLTDA